VGGGVRVLVVPIFCSMCCSLPFFCRVALSVQSGHEKAVVWQHSLRYAEAFFGNDNAAMPRRLGEWSLRSTKREAGLFNITVRVHDSREERETPSTSSSAFRQKKPLRLLPQGMVELVQ